MFQQKRAEARLTPSDGAGDHGALALDAKCVMRRSENCPIP